jgi:hypothetical protein
MTRSPSDNLNARLEQRAQVLAQDTSFDWLRPRQRRRALVLVQSLVIAGLVLNAFVRQPTTRQAFIGLGLTILAFVGTFLLRVTMRGMADFPDAAVDERIITTRNAAYLGAYRLLAGCTSMVLLGVMVLASARKQLVSVDTITSLMLGFLMASVSLPSAVLAWNETDA